MSVPAPMAVKRPRARLDSLAGGAARCGDVWRPPRTEGVSQLKRTTMRSALRRVYSVAVLALGVAAVLVMLSLPAVPQWPEFALLAILGAAASQLKVRLPGAQRPESLAIVVILAAILRLTALSAFLVAAISIVGDTLADRRHRLTARRLALEIVGAAIAVLCASTIHGYLLRQAEVGWPLALAFAALIYYLVGTAIRIFQTALETWVSPWSIWKSDSFWNVPLYLGAPVAVGAGQQLLLSSRVAEIAWALPLALAVGLYLKAWFTRLRRREQKAEDQQRLQRRAIEALALAIDSRDGGTQHELERLRKHADRLAKAAGCSPSEIGTLDLAVVLHDVGKVAIPESILKKPGRLTPQEFNLIAQHATAGAEIVSQVSFPAAVEQTVLCHHEHWDGSGYPRGLSGEQIPKLARILAVADCFNALLSDRPYRAALTVEEALEALREQRGKTFDPSILDTFLGELPSFRDELRSDLESERGRPKEKAMAPQEAVVQTPAGGGDHETLVRRQTLQGLMANPDHLLVFYEILRNLGADLHFDKSIQQCLQALRSAIAFDKAGVFIFERDHYVLLQGEGFPDHCISRLSLSLQHGLAARVAETRLAIAADGPPSELPDGHVPRFLDDVQSSLVAPLVVDEELIGVIALCAAQPGAFGEEQANFLSLITPKLASTVASSRTLQRIYLEAETDEMTSLPNARAAFRKLDAEIKRAQRQGQKVAVLYIDLDGLKPINDSYGHAAGDKLLLEVGRHLKTYLRSYDFLGRVGGDEFLAIVPGIEREGLDGKVKALKKGVAGTMVRVTEGVYLRPAISIGAALFPEDATDVEELIYLSDRRMFRDKQRSQPGTDVKGLARISHTGSRKKPLNLA